MNLYLTTQGSKIGIDEGEFYIKDPEQKELGRFPQKLVENIFIFGNVFLTTQALNFCLKNKIRVLFLSSKGDYIGSLISIDQDKVLFKYKQWEKFKNEKLRLQLSKIIIKEKFKNQRGLIYGFAKNQERKDLFMTFDEKTKPLIVEVDRAQELSKLRGLEGVFSTIYFQTFKELILNRNFSFQGRSHYPPKDEVNSLLSFGYTLLVNFITGFIISYSLDPYVGFYHENRYKRENLSLDVMEEFRPQIDQIVLKLINLKIISIDHFEKKDDYFLIKKDYLNKIFFLFQKDIISKSKVINLIEKRVNNIVKIINNYD